MCETTSKTCCGSTITTKSLYWQAGDKYVADWSPKQQAIGTAVASECPVASQVFPRTCKAFPKGLSLEMSRKNSYFVCSSMTPETNVSPSVPRQGCRLCGTFLVKLEVRYQRYERSECSNLYRLRDMVRTIEHHLTGHCTRVNKATGLTWKVIWRRNSQRMCSRRIP